MSFKKYPSLTNHYATKDIDYFVRRWGDEINKTKWCVTEKIHGANFSFLVSKNQPVKYFSRNQEITGSDFYNSSEVIDRVLDRLDSIQKLSDKFGYSVRLFGELYGSGVQKGVEYPPGRSFKIFNIMINDRLVSESTMRGFLDRVGLGDMVCPILAVCSFKEAMEYDIEFDSTYSDKEDNLCEGIVIKPYTKVFVDNQGSMFAIKKKNEKFKESQRVKKVRTETNYSEEVNEWREIFLSYIHDERVESVYSKEGRIESFKDLGKYIPLIHLDALDTFRKEETDWDEDKFTKSERKYIFNSSKIIVELLKKELMG